MEHGVPLGYVVGGRVVLAFQRRLGQPRSVVRRGHDLELHRPGTVAGQQVDGELEAAVRTAVGEQLGILPIHGALQLSEYALIAGPSEDERPSHVPEPGGLIREGRQLIHQRHLTDAGADVVHGVEAAPQAGQGGHPGAAPGIGALTSGNGGKKQGRGAVQLLRPEGEGGGPAVVGGHHQPGNPDAALNQRRVVGPGGLGYRAVQQMLQKELPLAGEQQRPALFVPPNEAHAHEVFPIPLRGDSPQVPGLNELAPAQQLQNINVPMAENHAYRTSLHIPARAENALAPVPAQELFRRFSKPPMGSQSDGSP